ncbi:MAG: hypothetical protein ACI88A_000215 [Paraglaciecola sp.]|jgi:hypothetical protein
MSKIFRHKDKHGSYQLDFKNNILRALVIGAIGDSLSRHFHADVLTLVTGEDSHPWAYYGDLLLCDGATFQAEQSILNANIFSTKNGCCIDAYRLQSPLVKDQIARIRAKTGVKTKLEEHTFDTENEALTFLHKQLKLYVLNHSELK